jgi:Ni/Co efflux regulator RcnB
MKKFVTAAVAATVALGSVGMASAAEAQSRGDRYEQRQDRREWRQERREDRREWRQDRREVRQQQRAYARWQQAQRRYHAPRYVAPRGYQYRSWSYGQSMPYAYRTQRYVINDYDRYGLARPPHGYQYVRSGNDVVLAAVAGGLISAVIAGLFN